MATWLMLEVLVNILCYKSIFLTSFEKHYFSLMKF